MQDCYDSIKKRFVKSSLINFTKKRLLTADIILNCCREDKIEASDLVLDSVNEDLSTYKYIRNY